MIGWHRTFPARSFAAYLEDHLKPSLGSQSVIVLTPSIPEHTTGGITSLPIGDT